MAVEIKSENIDVGGSGVLLVSVKGGSAVIGTCTAGYCSRSPQDSTSVTRLFYMGNDPVVDIECPNNASPRTDKLISFCPGFQGVDNDIRTALSDSFIRINRGESLEIGLREIFGLLTDGVYTVYLSEYYPTDGNGTFFWGAYNISHEVHGTAQHNRTIGLQKPYRPCFLIPSQPLNSFAPKIKSTTDESTKSRSVQGIAYHLTGLHSVLLKGHHGAASCVEHNLPFKCAVIEKIVEPYTDPPVMIQVPASGEASENEAAAATVAEVPHEGITGFRSASVKIPLELFPKDMLRIMLETRTETKPEQFNVLMKHLNSVRRKSVSNQVLPHYILERCDVMPDVEMIESAFAIDNLTDEQLNCLLAGETELNGEVIISPNFYASVVTACNYLQFHSEPRFIEFALSIMDNPELYATHEYIARRVSRLAGSKKVYNYFKRVTESEEPGHEKILSIAEKFVQRYEREHEV